MTDVDKDKPEDTVADHTKSGIVQSREYRAQDMDDFSHMMQLLETAQQLAEMNELPILAYLVGVAKEEARAHRFALRDKKLGRCRKT